MFETLRARLLASYVVILLVMLLLIGFVLFVFTATRPLPTDDLVSELTGTLLDVRLISLAKAEMRMGEVGEGRFTSNDTARGLEERFSETLRAEAEARDTRILLLTNDGRILYDTAAIYHYGEHLIETERLPLLPPSRLRIPGTLFRGRFQDPEGTEWLSVAQPLRPLTEMRPDSVLLMVATPVPQKTFQEVTRLFGRTFFLPLAQAGIIGLGIALGLSVLVSASVARPLQRISEAAQRIARGYYRQRVPIEGPKEVRTLARTFNYMADRVAATQQAQQDFLANVSHDLRTPLTSIQGFSQAIAEGVAADPEAARRAAQIIHDEAGRLHRMVESLLDLARIEADKLTMRQHAVEPSAVLQVVGESLSVKAREKGVRLTLQVPPDLPRIPGDGDRLAQVFTNLIDNAIKHTSEGGQVALRADADGQGIVVVVQDTGEGIPPEDLPRIFERFYQVDKSRESNRRSGMGLGLAITKQIVEAHGGTIQVASKLGEGTIFTVWLPFSAPDTATLAAER